jgi:hypothetical protein
MAEYQYFRSRYPEETGGLFRRNGRTVPTKRAAYSEEMGGGPKRPNRTGLCKSLYSEETGVPSEAFRYVLRNTSDRSILNP